MREGCQAIPTAAADFAQLHPHVGSRLQDWMRPCVNPGVFGCQAPPAT